MLDIATKTDNNGDTLSAVEFNNYIGELENVVTSAGLALDPSPSVITQLAQAIPLLAASAIDFTVKTNQADMEPGFLFEKLVEEVGIQITEGVGPNIGKVVINVVRATTSEAINGVSAEVVMTPLNVQQKAATNTEAAAGLLDTKFLTPANVASIRGSVYGVGDVIFTANNVNPSGRFGGTWAQRAQGRFIVGVGAGNVDSVSRTYTQGNDSVGRYEVGLTTPQMPAHSHRAYGTTSTGGSTDPLNSAAFAGEADPGPVYSANGLNGNPLIEQTGGTEKHENSPPGFGLYVWERTA